jgi:DNA invertase Pin-like site-specific DNA recombinase
MLGVFAEFETNLCKERQLEGISKAKQEGRYTGGKRRIDREEIARLKAEGLGAVARVASGRRAGCNLAPYAQ